MFFSKKSGFHCLVLFIKGAEAHPLHLVIPQEFGADVISTMKKLEKSALNNERYLGNLGPFTIIQDIQGLSKIEIHNDTYPWSEPVLYTDYAKKVNSRLQSLLSEEAEAPETEDLEEDLVYFIGEFTMMQDNGFSAPF